MPDRAVQSRLLPTPFVSSFIARARRGDKYDADPARRAAAWAQWAVDGLAEFRGLSDREYVALRLPGRFHDPRGNGPKVPPHLEISPRVLSRPDPEFPDRLAQAGNALVFPWWLVGEVTATRRVLFNTAPGSVAELVDAVNAHRTGLVSATRQLSSTIGGHWNDIEAALVAAPETLQPYVTEPFTVAEIAALFPPAAGLELTVSYDQKLRDDNGRWAVRRLGAWQLAGVGSDGPLSLGVVVPRLTANSLLRDELFAVDAEAPASLLVRALLLRRLVSGFLASEVPGTLTPDPKPPGRGGPHLRGIVARPGAKLPEAHVEAAVHFLQTYPSAEMAWEALRTWAGDTYLLTVSWEGFAAAHQDALRYLRRAETPERDHINVLLPLTWDDQSRLVRATFSRPPAGTAESVSRRPDQGGDGKQVGELRPEACQ